MTKKHFKRLADELRWLRERHGASLPAGTVVSVIAGVCADFNPNFDHNKFVEACEPRPAEKR